LNIATAAVVVIVIIAVTPEKVGPHLAAVSFVVHLLTGGRVE
jgi:hypothetical protein